MRNLVLAVMVIVMIAGGTLAALKFLEIGPFVTKEDPQEKKIEPPRFIDMDPLTVPLIVQEKVAGHVVIQLKLEAVGAKNETKVRHLLPRLNDAYLSELHTFIPRLLQKTKRLDIFILKKRLQMVSDRVVGKGVVSNVLVQSVSNTAKQ